MKNIKILLITIIVLLGIGIQSASAQSTTELISLHPMDESVRAALLDWLEVSKPVQAPYYAVTYIAPAGVNYAVSLAALNIGTADEEWHVTEEANGESKILWIGSVIVHPDGSVEELFPPVGTSHKPNGLASMRYAGGGTYVNFPISAGSYAIYGPRGVHGEGDYGTSGLVAVDLVGGDDLPGSMFPSVYASDTGTIDYVCDDGTSVAVRTFNATTGDYFIYAHLKNNANLTVSHSFSKNALVGELVYGTFNGSCGWAEQKDNHYHVHWMFQPSGGHYRAEGCVLDMASKKWTCGTQTVGIGGKLYGGGGSGTSGSGLDDPGTNSSVANSETGFWDYLLIGFVSIFDRGILKLLPQHNSPTAPLIAIFNIIRIMLKIAWTLTRFNINLGPIMTLALVTISAKLIFGAIWLVFAIIRTIKAIPGA